MIPTKTIIPRQRERLLGRPRLINHLHRHTDRALTLVSAPAGYGKTALLADFSCDAPFPTCWLSLDQADQDMQVFVEYLVAAIRRCFPDFGEMTLQALLNNRDPVALAGAIVQDVINHVPEFFALILDDYHEIETSQQVNSLLEAILRYRPDYWHLIIASRTVPPKLPIVLLTALDQIASIGQAQLAFTLEELQALMQHLYNLELTQEQANDLISASEGWITGILLSAACLWRGMRNVLARANLQKSADSPIYAYLAEQVFAEQPAKLRDFMLVSSTLSEMNEELCQAVLGLHDVNDTLHKLEQRGVFMTMVEDEETGVWYRYHHLFRDFMQERLQRQDIDLFQKLHSQAADWLEENDQVEQAVTHRLVSGNPDQTVQMMDKTAQTLFYAGRLETLVNWLEQTPEALQPKAPSLLLFVARAQIALGHSEKAISILHQAESSFQEQGRVQGALFAALERAMLWYNTWGRFEDALAVAQKILAEPCELLAPLAEAHRLAGLACLKLGLAPQMFEHFEASLELYRQLGWTNEVAGTCLDLSFALLQAGRLNAGWMYQDKALEIYRQSGRSEQLAMTLNNIAYDRYYLAADYAQALDCLNEALQIARDGGCLRSLAFVLLTIADLYRGLGALESAMALYEQASEISRRLGNVILTNFALIGIAQVQVETGNVIEALGSAKQVCSQAQAQGDVYQLGLAHLLMGKTYLNTGEIAKALCAFERGCGLLTQSNAQRDLTRAYMLLARAHQAADANEQARSCLEKALDIGIETCTWHHLLIEGQHTFGLFKQMLEHNPLDRRPTQVMERIRALPDTARRVVGKLDPMVLPCTPTLRFYSLGAGNVEKDGRSVPTSAWRSAIPRYLTFYLLSYSPCRLEQIIDTFWPDTPHDRARSTFHVTKQRIRHALGRPLIVYQDGLYYIDLDPDCWFDMTVFDSLLDGQDNRQARLEKTMALYQGDFMEGYDAEWCLPIRERLRLRFRDALVELGEIYTVKEKREQAFTHLAKAIAIDDLYEPAIRGMMHLYFQSGRRQSALRLYKKLEQNLHKTMGITPDDQSQALFEVIQKNCDVSQP